MGRDRPRFPPRPGAVFFLPRHGPARALGTKTTERVASARSARSRSVQPPRCSGESRWAGHVEASTIILTQDRPPLGLPAKPRVQGSPQEDPLPPTPTAAPAPGSAAVFPLCRDPGRDGTVGPRQGPQALPLASDSSGPTATTTRGKLKLRWQRRRGCAWRSSSGATT